MVAAEVTRWRAGLHRSVNLPPWERWRPAGEWLILPRRLAAETAAFPGSWRRFANFSLEVFS